MKNQYDKPAKNQHDKRQWQTSMTTESEKPAWQTTVTNQHDKWKWQTSITKEYDKQHDKGMWQTSMTTESDKPAWQMKVTNQHDRGKSREILGNYWGPYYGGFSKSIQAFPKITKLPHVHVPWQCICFSSQMSFYDGSNSSSFGCCFTV